LDTEDKTVQPMMHIPLLDGNETRKRLKFHWEVLKAQHLVDVTANDAQIISRTTLEEIGQTD
jgi:hypothetical protein